MSLRISCPHCTQHYRVPDELGGKQFKCKKCGGRISIPKIDVAPEMAPLSNPLGSLFDDELPPAALSEHGSGAPLPAPPMFKTRGSGSSSVLTSFQGLGGFLWTAMHKTPLKFLWFANLVAAPTIFILWLVRLRWLLLAVGTVCSLIASVAGIIWIVWCFRTFGLSGFTDWGKHLRRTAVGIGCALPVALLPKDCPKSVGLGVAIAVVAVVLGYLWWEFANTPRDERRKMWRGTMAAVPIVLLYLIGGLTPIFVLTSDFFDMMASRRNFPPSFPSRNQAFAQPQNSPAGLGGMNDAVGVIEFQVVSFNGQGNPSSEAKTALANFSWLDPASAVFDSDARRIVVNVRIMSFDTRVAAEALKSVGFQLGAVTFRSKQRGS